MSENNSIFLLASECQCSDINHEGVNGVNKGLQLEEGESLCKNVLRQKPCVGEGEELLRYKHFLKTSQHYASKLYCVRKAKKV